MSAPTTVTDANDRVRAALANLPTKYQAITVATPRPPLNTGMVTYVDAGLLLQPAIEKIVSGLPDIVNVDLSTGAIVITWGYTRPEPQPVTENDLTATQRDALARLRKDRIIANGMGVKYETAVALSNAGFAELVATRRPRNPRPGSKSKQSVYVWTMTLPADDDKADQS